MKKYFMVKKPNSITFKEKLDLVNENNYRITAGCL